MQIDGKYCSIYFLRHATVFVPRRLCDACLNSIECLRCPLGCDHPTMPTQECTKSGCHNIVHHICQITCQRKYGFSEELLSCISCHTQARHLSQDLRGRILLNYHLNHHINLHLNHTINCHLHRHHNRQHYHQLKKYH